MFAPTYLSSNDRLRLVQINQSLLGVLTPEEAADLREEQQAILAKTKDLPQCTFEELQELRAQLFDQYQKHQALGSKQTSVIAQYIRQVEFREMAFAHRPTDELSGITSEKPQAATKPKSPGRVSTRPSKYSWSIDVD